MAAKENENVKKIIKNIILHTNIHKYIQQSKGIKRNGWKSKDESEKERAFLKITSVLRYRISN